MYGYMLIDNQPLKINQYPQVVIDEPTLTIQQLSERMDERAGEVIKYLVSAFDGLNGGLMGD
jgi:hypothetical protein